MTFLDWIGVPENVALAKKAAQSVVETAIASALGNLELDLQPRILDPIAGTMDRFVTHTLEQLDKFVDKQLAKLKNVRVSY